MTNGVSIRIGNEDTTIRNCLHKVCPMKRLLAQIAILAVSLHCGSVFAATYHVSQRSPQASDAGPGTAERPWRSISKAAEAMQPGDSVVIHAGVYREHVRPGRSGTASAPITYQAAPGEEVVLTGADVLTGWTSVGDGVWKKEPWTYRFATHPNDAKHRLIGRCEQVIVDGRLLAQVDCLEKMAPGSFFADTDHKVLYVRLAGDRDPNQAVVEASVRAVCFGPGWGGGRRDYITVRGLVIRHAANMAQRGRFSPRGIIGPSRTALSSIPTGPAFRFTETTRRFAASRRATTDSRGSAAAAGTSCSEEVALEHNNVKGYDKDWEGGGMKIAVARDGVVRRCRAVANNGVGLWFDIDVRDVVVEDCFCSRERRPRDLRRDQRRFHGPQQPLRRQRHGRRVGPGRHRDRRKRSCDDREQYLRAQSHGHHAPRNRAARVQGHRRQTSQLPRARRDGPPQRLRPESPLPDRPLVGQSLLRPPSHALGRLQGHPARSGPGEPSFRRELLLDGGEAATRPVGLSLAFGPLDVFQPCRVANRAARTPIRWPPTRSSSLPRRATGAFGPKAPRGNWGRPLHGDHDIPPLADQVRQPDVYHSILGSLILTSGNRLRLPLWSLWPDERKDP